MYKYNKVLMYSKDILDSYFNVSKYNNIDCGTLINVRKKFYKSTNKYLEVKMLFLYKTLIGIYI